MDEEKRERQKANDLFLKNNPRPVISQEESQRLDKILDNVDKKIENIQTEEFKGKEFSFRPLVEVNYSNFIGESYTTNKINGGIKTEKHYSIHAFKFTENGGLNKEFILIIPPNSKIQNGTFKTYLTPLNTTQGTIEILSQHPIERPILEKLCKILKIHYKNIKDEDIIEQFTKAQNNSPVFFQETSGLPDSELKQITRNDWKNYLDDYQSRGGEFSEIVTRPFKAGLIQPNPQLIEPKRFMPYNCHSIIVANSKIGKSTQASTTGILSESASIANLLGFSTANETNQGSLHNQTKSFTMDEIQEEKNEELYSKLSTFMEQGETSIFKGKKRVDTKGYSPIIFTGNPKPTENNETGKLQDWSFELFDRFNSIQCKISKNSQALGGRISSFVFRADIPEVKFIENIPIENIERNKAIVESILDKAKDNFSKLYLDKNVLDWLNKPLPDEYSKKLREFSKQAKLQGIKELISGHSELAKRHVRGFAFRLSCVDNAITLMNGNHEIKTIIEGAEEYLNEIIEQNLFSFSNLTDLSTKTEYLSSARKNAFEKLSKDAKECVFELWEAYEGSKAKSISEISLRENVDPVGKHSRSYVVDRFFADIGRLNKELVKIGLKAENTSEGKILKIVDTEAFDSIVDEIKKVKL